MATYIIRGSSHCVTYPYFTETGKYKKQWETYTTELEAIQRKAYIDFLQKCKRRDDILKAVIEYRSERQQEKDAAPDTESAEIQSEEKDNLQRTYGEFVEKWLPFHMRKKRCSPGTYDNYRGNLNVHILPFFGSKIMSKITAEDIDDFLDHLSQKPLDYANCDKSVR